MEISDIKVGCAYPSRIDDTVAFLVFEVEQGSEGRIDDRVTVQALYPSPDYDNRQFAVPTAVFLMLARLPGEPRLFDLRKETPIPRDVDQARRMHLVSEAYLKVHNPKFLEARSNGV